MERDRFIGFYWTLPVPTHGFTALPGDAEEAARRSRTVAHQRAVVRAWVEEEGGILADEAVFLELDPDHGTEHILPLVETLLGRCRREGCQLLVVALWEMQEMGWRRHHRLIARLEEEERAAEAEGREPHCIVLPPGQGEDGQRMIEHFGRWRAVRAAFTEGKPAQEALVRQVVEDLRRAGGARASSAVLARALNARGIATPNGRRWTAANLRQFLRRAGEGGTT